MRPYIYIYIHVINAICVYYYIKKTYTDILYGLCVLNCDIIKGEVEFGSI